MTASLRWGVLGASARIFTTRLRPAFEGTEGNEIVATASRDGADEAPYRALLARSDIDAVYIPLPNSMHRPWIERALDAGKHVLCEKPITMTAADTDAVFALAAERDRVLAEAYMWPHHPRARLIRSLAATELGALRSLHSTFTFPLGRPGDHRLDERGGGALLDVGIYCIAPAMLLAGRDPVAVACRSVHNDRGADVFSAGWIDWGAGFSSTFEVSFDSPDRRMMELSGTEGFLSLDGDAEMPATPGWHVPGPEATSVVRVRRRSGPDDEYRSEGASAFVEMIGQFARVTAGLEPPEFGPDASRRLARVLEALRSSARQPPSTRP